MFLSFGQLVPWLQIEIFYKLAFFPIPVSIFPKFTLCDIFLQSRKIWGKSPGCQIHFRVLVHNILVKVIPFGHSNIAVKHRYSYCCCFLCCLCCVLCFLWVSCNDDFCKIAEIHFFMTSRTCTDIWRLYRHHEIYSLFDLQFFFLITIKDI